MNNSTNRRNRARIIRNWGTRKGSHHLYQTATDAMMRAEASLSYEAYSFRLWLHDAAQGTEAYQDGGLGVIRSARTQLDRVIADLTACRQSLH